MICTTEEVCFYINNLFLIFYNFWVAIQVSHRLRRFSRNDTLSSTIYKFLELFKGDSDLGNFKNFLNLAFNQKLKVRLGKF